MKHLTQAGYLITRWSGGTTTQIAIAPHNAVYEARDFLWRVSSAAVEDEQSTFTPLPDYHRWLLLLEGSIRLSHNSGAPFLLEPFQAYEFDGGAATTSAGICRDFNLMLRKGKCCGALRPLRFPGAGEALIRCHAPEIYSHQTLLLYCAKGRGSVTHSEETCSFAQGESVLLEGSGEPHLTVPVVADFVLAEIFY